MINVFIDTARLSEDLYLNERQVADLMDFTVKTVTDRFAEEWINEANRTLKTSRAQYIQNIIVVDDGYAKGSVVLTGEHANSIENGFEGFDMKPGLLAGPNAKTTKDGGKYNVVPFSIGTPGALEENFNGGIMPQEVYDVVKSKPVEKMLPGGGMASKPLTVDDLPQPFQQPKTKSVVLPGTKTAKDYQHKHSIYEGIRKVQDPVTKQNKYQSFRAVSSNSDPLAWIHPGVEAKNIAEKVLQDFNVPAETGRAIDIFLEGL